MNISSSFYTQDFTTFFFSIKIKKGEKKAFISREYTHILLHNAYINAYIFEREKK